MRFAATVESGQVSLHSEMRSTNGPLEGGFAGTWAAGYLGSSSRNQYYDVENERGHIVDTDASMVYRNTGALTVDGNP